MAEQFPVVVYWQNSEDCFFHALPENVELVRVRGVGVNISRNLAIATCRTKYLYFMDDDVLIDVPKLLEFVSTDLIKYSNNHLLLLPVLDFDYNPRKNYPICPSKVGLHNSMKYGVSEMLFNVPKILDLGVKFDESLGAGTTLPVGDEFKLIGDLIKGGGEVFFVPRNFARHPAESSGFSVSIKALKSRYKVCKHVFGFLGPLVWLILVSKLYIRSVLKFF